MRQLDLLLWLGISTSPRYGTWVLLYTFIVVNKLKLTLTIQELTLLHLAGRISHFIVSRKVPPQFNNIEVLSRLVVLEPKGIFSFLQNNYHSFDLGLITKVPNDTQPLRTSLLIRQYCFRRRDTWMINLCRIEVL